MKWAYESGYTENLSIDRIDVNGDYKPSNCQWVDSVAQANNRRSNRIITYGNESHNVTEWARILGMNSKLLFQRLDAGWDVERAFNT